MLGDLLRTTWGLGACQRVATSLGRRWSISGWTDVADHG